jgi:outer membrane lipoprotein
MEKLVLIIAVLLCVAISACAPIISPELRREVREEITLSQVRKDPDPCKGKVVIWGGKIVGAANKREGTLIEVLQLPLDRSDRPKEVDTSEGRFLTMHPDYLDVAIYRQGREITVVGEIEGVKTLPLGEIEYRYPFIKAKKIHLWEVGPESIGVCHEFPPYPFWYRPYWWRYHYCW